MSRLLAVDYTRGAATRKARSPIVLRQDRGTISDAEDAERRRSLDGTAATGTRLADKYSGARPWRQRNVSTASLYVIRSGARSQRWFHGTCRFYFAILPRKPDYSPRESFSIFASLPLKPDQGELAEV
jgi:hypothetical protein